APIGPDEHPYVFAGLHSGLLRSTDGGGSWESAPLPSPSPIFSFLAPSPDFAQDGTLFAATLGCGVLIYKSFGSQLSMWNFGLLDHEILCLGVSTNFLEDHTIFAGAQSGLFLSTNGGRSWTDIDLPIGYEPVLSLAISPDFANDHLLYAGTESKGILCSSDCGKKWKQLGEGVLVNPINSILLDPQFPKKSNILIVHGDNPLFSSDYGYSWEHWRNESLDGLDVSSLLAPEGFSDGVPVVVGLFDGGIRLIP
ncbi:MAG: WD40/YVTN/BNR-like repeat-containing protein, partial [Anaerolineales bacterium]